MLIHLFLSNVIQTAAMFCCCFVFLVTVWSLCKGKCNLGQPGCVCLSFFQISRMSLVGVRGGISWLLLISKEGFAASNLMYLRDGEPDYLDPRPSPWGFLGMEHIVLKWQEIWNKLLGLRGTKQEQNNCFSVFTSGQKVISGMSKCCVPGTLGIFFREREKLKTGSSLLNWLSIKLWWKTLWICGDDCL